MKEVHPFLIYLQKFIPISEKDFLAEIMPIITVRDFDKKQLLIKAGEVEDNFNFILKGLVRKYYQKGNVQINTQISTEGQMILSQESFHSRLPSEYFIETIEPTRVVTMRYDALEALYSSSHRMERLGRLIVTYSMVIKDRWQIQLVKLTPRERFLNFVTRNPELLQRVPQKYLATYLNIKPETFSRFKHLLKEHSRKKE